MLKTGCLLSPSIDTVDAKVFGFQSTVNFPTWLSIANKDHRVFGRLFLAIENTQFSSLSFARALTVLK